MNTSYLCDGKIGRAAADGCDRLILFASGEAALDKISPGLPDEVRRVGEATLTLLDKRLEIVEAAGLDGSSFRRRGEAIAEDFRRAAGSFAGALLADKRTAFAAVDLHAWLGANHDAQRATMKDRQLSDDLDAMCKAAQDAQIARDEAAAPPEDGP